MALTKCKECKKEVSTTAKVCPHCGVKNPGTTFGQTLGAAAIVIAIGWGVFHWIGSDDESTAAKAEAPKTCSATDGRCLFKANIVDATVYCKPLVEKSSKYDHEWTDGILENIFSRFQLDSTNNQLTFIGDKVKFTNGFNAKTTMTYSCTLDLNTKRVVNFDIAEGKL
ncbi:hypothetical protein [Pectobacterium polaris]|uniref:hypothetical protein n=1 Tax=Pectobacterium polaris TaxID=2042057 RepID=UPI000F8D0E92|nr:hypothetical protein [Pectobacterium polaris]RUS01689.1 zinc ribbon domain-containing protein [Pectobacterium polaris]